MARPVKNFCDFFPHMRDMRNHKKIKAIRTKFGITGYGIWVMILEYLTGNDGNEFEFSDLEIELMSGDFGVSVTEITDVLNYCIKLELLFNRNGFIHSESLDENLQPVYDKRNIAKDKSKKQKRKYGKFVDNNTVPTVITVTEIPHSRVDNSKEEKIIIAESENFKMFKNWILENAPSVAKMQKPFTEAEFIRLAEDGFDWGFTCSLLQSMDNYKKLKDKVSANMTFRKWAETHNYTPPQQQTQLSRKDDINSWR